MELEDTIRYSKQLKKQKICYENISGKECATIAVSTFLKTLNAYEWRTEVLFCHHYYHINKNFRNTVYGGIPSELAER